MYVIAEAIHASTNNTNIRLRKSACVRARPILVVTGQAPIILEWNNTLGKAQENQTNSGTHAYAIAKKQLLHPPQITGQAPVSLEWKNTLRKTQSKNQKWYTHIL